MSSYISGFSDLIEQYEKYQKISDSWSDHAYGLNIRYFDRYCALHYPGQPLCQEMIDEWCRKRDTETNASCFTRTGGIRSFIRYLRDRGLTTVEPAKPPKPEGKTYIPHAVSSFLNDRPRPGQPAHYTDEQIIKILEIACREPQEFGYEVRHWSLNLLVNAVVKEGIVESISAKTVSLFLKYGGNPPASHPLLASFLRENRFSGNFCGESE